jgi:hypothetical protein
MDTNELIEQLQRLARIAEAGPNVDSPDHADELIAAVIDLRLRLKPIVEPLLKAILDSSLVESYIDRADDGGGPSPDCRLFYERGRSFGMPDKDFLSRMPLMVRVELPDDDDEEDDDDSPD